jgi:tRNA nucleotidyltransferase (CCA-adding enzyme)
LLGSLKVSTTPPGIEVSAIPAEVLEVLAVLQQAGHRAVLVGGSVRDLLLGQAPKDFDLATSARPDAVQRLFRKVIPTGIAHGTVTVLHRGRHLEVTTFRAEADYLDGRRPSKVEFHDDVDADLSRRDFTINAMAWDPASGLVDPFGGQADLAARRVRCVRDALARFQEDGLRPLRAVRFATVLDFALDPATEAAIPRTLDVFAKVALERVNQEFVKILLSPRAEAGLALLRSTGLLAGFLPEARADRFSAVGRGPVDEAARLALLLEGQGRLAELVSRLKFPRKVADEAQALAAARPLPPEGAPEPALRRWLAKVTLGRLEPVLALNDALGVPLEPLAGRLRAVASRRPPLSARELALDGRGVMEALGVGPSALVGEATRYLLEQVLEDPTLNSPEGLRGLLREWPRRPG